MLSCFRENMVKKSSHKNFFDMETIDGSLESQQRPQRSLLMSLHYSLVGFGLSFISFEVVMFCLIKEVVFPSEILQPYFAHHFGYYCKTITFCKLLKVEIHSIPARKSIILSIAALLCSKKSLGKKYELGSQGKLISLHQFQLFFVILRAQLTKGCQV